MNQGSDIRYAEILIVGTYVEDLLLHLIQRRPQNFLDRTRRVVDMQKRPPLVASVDRDLSVNESPGREQVDDQVESRSPGQSIDRSKAQTHWCKPMVG